MVSARAHTILIASSQSHNIKTKECTQIYADSLDRLLPRLGGAIEASSDLTAAASPQHRAATILQHQKTAVVVFCHVTRIRGSKDSRCKSVDYQILARIDCHLTISNRSAQELHAAPVWLTIHFPSHWWC
ncbi:hypothetical protein O3P69_018797 [Scylla paramamosain]|uniref:Uncharacterized protein n=1 Tax=Scylla paramamosain TaxID=85552 RepID=A0AAW0SRP8_SCYPA